MFDDLGRVKPAPKDAPGGKPPDSGGMTLAEVADALGCSRERVRQLEQRALAKFEIKLRARGYRLEDLL